MGDTGPVTMQAAIRHGGDLGRARASFPLAPEPWIDLSTGINPHSYPHSPIPASAFARLPEPSALNRLKEVAAAAFGAPSAAHIVAAPGTQMLMPLLAELALQRGAKRAAVLTPAYAEHARTARMAGLDVAEVSNFSNLSDFDYAVVINPNNPDGRVMGRGDLLGLAAEMSRKSGLLVIDARLEQRLGPWAVSGPALHVAAEALGDNGWRDAMRLRLRTEVTRLDAILTSAGLTVVGGTSLFRLVRDARAAALFAQLANRGILVRIFDERSNDMRFGLPGTEAEWARLEAALSEL